MKKFPIILLTSVLILFCLPLLAVKFAGMNGMAFCFIMFFAINPIYFIFLGITSGRKVKNHWYLPIISSLIYLFSMWTLFEMAELAFVMYAGVYLVISIVTMLITSLIIKGK